MTEQWDTQMEALGEFIRRRRKLANLSLRQLAEKTRLDGEGHAAPGTPAVEQAVEADLRLSDQQKAALISVYRSMLGAG